MVLMCCFHTVCNLNGNADCLFIRKLPSFFNIFFQGLLHVDVNIVSNDILDVEAFKNWRPEYHTAEFILEDGKYVCGWAVEKMSKSMYNVVNPDMIVEKYGADTLRMYEMFLGPVEQSKPWDTNGIDGVHRFLKKLWSLFYDRQNNFLPVEGEATKEELKSTHKLIQKVSADIEAFSYNTSISAFMICVNELTALKCRNKAVLSDLVVLIAPFAPHLAEELWEVLGHTTSVCDAQWPLCNEEYLKEDTVKYTISFNGKARFTMEFPADADNDTIQQAVMNEEQSQKWIEGKTPKKVIIVPKKIVNIVLYSNERLKHGSSVEKEVGQGVERLPCHYFRANRIFTGMGIVHASISDNHGWCNRYCRDYLLCDRGGNTDFLFCDQCHFSGIRIEDIGASFQYKDHLCHLYADVPALVFSDAV